jgi:type II secretory pathway component PulM
LEQTPFDGLVSWVAQLRESYGIRVDSAVIEPAAAPGTVNSTMVLHAR